MIPDHRRKHLIVPRPSGSTLVRIRVGGSLYSYNKIISGSDRGIAWDAADLEEVATAYDPNAGTPSTITDDGIGYGVTETGDKVLLVTRQVVVGGTVRGGGMIDAAIYAISEADSPWVLAWRQIVIPVTGGTSRVVAWEVYWM